MFDPTAFDNMKVVIEGAIYDQDLSGEIVITDRNDVFNLAKMSRQFDISFGITSSKVTAKIEMESKLINVTAELLPNSSTGHLAGCYVRLQFFLDHEERIDFKEVKESLITIWGSTRKFSFVTHFNPLEVKKHFFTTVTVDFVRLVTEDQMEDLVDMTEFMVKTMELLTTKI